MQAAAGEAAADPVVGDDVSSEPLQVWRLFLAICCKGFVSFPKLLAFASYPLGIVQVPYLYN